MIEHDKEIFKWGPIDGKILYIDDFMDQAVNFRKKMKLSWPDMMDHIKDNKTLIIIENKRLRETGKKIFNNYILDNNKCKETYKTWLIIAKKIASLCFKNRESGLSKLSDNQLYIQLKEFYKIKYKFWAYGFIPELANWGGESILKEMIEKLYPNNFNEIFEALTAPEELSFYQIEERDLFNIKTEEGFLKHSNEYFWIKNSYGGVNYVGPQDFKKEYLKLNRDRINLINQYCSNVKKRKFDIQKKFSIPKEITDIGSQLSFSIWWQDLRKKYIFMMLHIINHFAAEIAKRNNLSKEDVELYTPNELVELSKSKKKVDLKERKIGFLSYYNESENKMYYLYGEKANNTIEKYTHIEIVKDIKVIKGLVTSRGKGKVKGKVRILSGARHFDSMQEGEILVTSMTSPEFIVAMRKAAAIVTDEGGMTCHAAIVSRELGVACIVGTKIATRVLHDGDLVEVDASTGIVKILERAK